MGRTTRSARWPFFLLVLVVTGCASPYHADRGALFGGLTGAGVGALVGEAVGEPAAGAAIGAGVGTVTGAAVGGSLDEIEARNRAVIEAELGRKVAEGAVGIDDVIAMSDAGVGDEVIVKHVELHGVRRSLETSDLIRLKQSGVSTRVIQAMQDNPQGRLAQAAPPEPASAPPPVVVERHYYDHDPWWGPGWHHDWHHHGHRRFHHRRPRSGVSWGFSFSTD